MAKVSKLPFLDEAVSLHTLVMLKQYHQWGLDARTFMLRQHSKVLDDIKAGRGHYANYSEDHRRFVQVCIYVELLNRVCLLLEDFSDLCYALSGDLKEFPRRVFSQPNPVKILRGLDHEAWHLLLRYSDVESLGLSEDEENLIYEIRTRNITHIQKLVDLFADFLDYHWLFYTKHKHGNTLIYGLDVGDLGGEPTLFIPALYNQKKPDYTTGVLVNESTYIKWQNLHDAVLTLSKDLVERTLLFIERNGVPIVEHVAYCPIDEKEKTRLNQIVEKCDKQVERIETTVKMNWSVPQLAVGKHNKLYAYLLNKSGGGQTVPSYPCTAP